MATAVAKKLFVEALEARVNPALLWWRPAQFNNWSDVFQGGLTNWWEFDPNNGLLGNWVQSKSIPGKADVALFTANEFGGGNDNCIVDTATTVGAIRITGGPRQPGNNGPGLGQFTKKLVLASELTIAGASS